MSRSRASAKTFETRCPACGRTRWLKHPPTGVTCQPCAALAASAVQAAKPRPTDLERLLSNVVKMGPGGCWLWKASLRANGYGQMFFRGRMTETHRAAYVLLVGEVPATLQLDHRCRVRECCNPAHLEPVTPRVNTLRGFGPSGINSRKIACNQGHPFDASNTYIDGVGKRHCRECRRATQQRRRQRNARAA